MQYQVFDKKLLGMLKTEWENWEQWEKHNNKMSVISI